MVGLGYAVNGAVTLKCSGITALVVPSLLVVFSLPGRQGDRRMRDSWWFRSEHQALSQKGKSGSQAEAIPAMGQREKGRVLSVSVWSIFGNRQSFRLIFRFLIINQGISPKNPFLRF